MSKPRRNPSSGAEDVPQDCPEAPDGQVLAFKHGEHAYDQWSVDELLSHARAAAT